MHYFFNCYESKKELVASFKNILQKFRQDNAVIVAMAGILGYIVHIAIAKNKKIEVAPAKVNSNQTTIE